MIVWLNGLLVIIKLISSGSVGLATTFSTNDPSNPDPRLYCTNKILDDKALIVAHPNLPCGSKVYLYAPRTRRSIIARVLDRGPRHAMIDMSQGATRALRANGMETVLLVPIP